MTKLRLILNLLFSKNSLLIVKLTKFNKDLIIQSVQIFLLYVKI